MKVYVYPADVDGCGFYRLIWPAQALQMQGHDVTVVPPASRTRKGDPRLQIEGDVDIRNSKLLNLRYPRDADVIVLQRVTNRVLWQGVDFMRANGTAVVIDMDDDLTAIDPWHPARFWLDPKNDLQNAWTHASSACARATLVTVSTPELLRTYAPRGNGVVLHNHVLREMADVERVENRRFGWTGSLHSHPRDPAVVGPAVQRLVREGFEFAMIGNPNGINTGHNNPLTVREAFTLDEDPWTTGAVPPNDWAAALMNLYVGIAPLSDTKFNRAKSWLKPLELAALGIPCVMSPLPEYRAIQSQHGIGVTAATPRDWYRQVKRLLTDDAWHKEVVERSLEGARGLVLEDNAWRWWDAWEHAFQLQQSA